MTVAVRRALTASADHLFLWRPILLTPVWAAYLLGARAARLHVAEAAGAWRLVPSHAEAAGLIAVTLLAAALYIVNQIVDMEVDRANNKLFILPRGAVSTRAAATHAAILGAGVLVLSVASLSAVERWLLVLAALTGLAYSVPPVRAKARAGFDILANGLSYGAFSFLLGWCALARHTGESGIGAAAIAACAPYVFASSALFVLSTLEDRAGDRAAGLNTSAVAWGERGVRAITLALATLAGLTGVMVREWPAVLWAVVAIPAYAYVLRAGGGLAPGFRMNQLAGRLLVIIAAPGSLVLLPVIAVLVLASRAYYARRFGLRYPRMTLEPAPLATAKIPVAGARSR